MPRKVADVFVVMKGQVPNSVLEKKTNIIKKGGEAHSQVIH